MSGAAVEARYREDAAKRAREARRQAEHAIQTYTEAAFALVVTGFALCPWPWLALVAAAAFLGALAVVADRRAPEAPE